MPKKPTPLPCPNCGRKTTRVGDCNYCKHCDRHYDDDPNEGGDFGVRPDARLEREERRRSNKPRR